MVDCNRGANWIKDINAELDELDREEFYRLKKVWSLPLLEVGWS